ncbi:DNA cytosine methyltransferase [Streptomyces sp. WAC 01529]|uniref:DNA cytosine methyltransferase n=1 Tax=Streptomyces sp. WAC 01529 TaxID=2203205 RepID=UPI0019D00852|nr:DNA cytosine methyltransferase [Streptomyces sp. WAC 01529]
MNLAQRMALFELLVRLGPVEWLDGFCGGGGSTRGIHLIPGQKTRVAINHWRPSVDVHQANNPDTDHDCADISQVDPRRYPRTDCAWFSPSCTAHSIAQGARFMAVDESAVRARSTMWDVQRFDEIHKYRFIIVENVVEVRTWVGFRAWKIAMADGGKCLHEVFLNAAHAGRLGDPAHQWRDRWFCLMHPKGTPCPDTDAWIAPAALCAACGPTTGRQTWKNGRDAGKYRRQYDFVCRTCAAPVEPHVRPAGDVIDWSLPTPVIGERKTPLAAKTMSRIEHGLREYGPALVPVEGRDGKRPFPVEVPMRTVTGRNETGLVVPPFIAELRGGSSKTRRVSEPLSTVCASGNHHGLVIPYYGRTRVRTTDEPFMTVTTVDRAALMPNPQPDINDCGFRMITPPEYARFMDFPDSYDWLAGRLSKRDRVRLAGQAVPVNMARDLVGCALESMAA